MSVPEWVQDAVFYQIFPDRFANGDPSNDPPNVHPWGSPPTNHGFQGGDLRGIIHRFDYLLDIGVNALYLNPIFQATSTHRYNTTDYKRIDPRLGTEADFHELLDLAHRNGVRVILDGVFNHCGRGFFAFNDLLENEAHSAFRDWFHVIRFPLDAYGAGEAHNYLAWWKHKSLPKFNTGNPAVRSYLLDIASHWVRMGTDGWRLDVPNEIDDDSFWAEFRGVVKEAGPEAYLVGEIWEADPRWVRPGHFDGLMNYPVRKALLGLLTDGKLDVTAFSQEIDRIVGLYTQDQMRSHYLPLGSHDTERVLTLCEGDLRKVRLMLLFQFCFPGAPAIYYGDEVGLTGGKDPQCRKAFPWAESAWNPELRELVQRLVRLRHETAPLRRGDFAALPTSSGSGIYAFARKFREEAVALAINPSEGTRTAGIRVGPLGWADGAEVVDLLGPTRRAVERGALRLRLGPYSGALLKRVR
jgi:glycosidase